MIFVRKDTMFLALKKDQILNLMAMREAPPLEVGGDGLVNSLL
ncbi:hypothetical protein QT235_11100 [Geobacillus stearothermophilus]|nr:hypothetical protein QT235_11100 [Geobacillus stearothermophilus]